MAVALFILGEDKKMANAIRYAMIKDGIVQNVCLWDGDTNTWTPPDGYLVIPAPDHIGTGWGYLDGVWTPPAANEEASA